MLTRASVSHTLDVCDASVSHTLDARVRHTSVTHTLYTYPGALYHVCHVKTRDIECVYYTRDTLAHVKEISGWYGTTRVT